MTKVGLGIGAGHGFLRALGLVIRHSFVISLVIRPSSFCRNSWMTAASDHEQAPVCENTLDKVEPLVGSCRAGFDCRRFRLPRPNPNARALGDAAACPGRSHCGTSTPVLRSLPRLSAARDVSPLCLEKRSQAGLRFLCPIFHAGHGVSAPGKRRLVLRETSATNTAFARVDRDAVGSAHTV